MEREFIKWFKSNEKRFAHGQFNEKQVAYSAWLEGQKQALRVHDVVEQSEQFYCSSSDDGQYPQCEAQCLGCAGLEKQTKQ